MGMIACCVYLNEALQKLNSVAEFELRINGFSKSIDLLEVNSGVALVRNI